MFAKATLIFTLIVSLLFATQASAVPRVEPAKSANCSLGCCASIACCVRSGAQPAPRVPAPVAPRHDLQVATPDLHTLSLLYALPVVERTFVILDKVRAGHALPPRLAGCVRLI